MMKNDPLSNERVFCFAGVHAPDPAAPRSLVRVFLQAAQLLDRQDIHDHFGNEGIQLHILR